MSKDNTDNAVQEKRPISVEDVRDYLISNPDFFDLNPDLLAVLKPTDTGRDDGIVDFQAVLRDRLQSEIVRLSDTQGSLIHASRSNMTTQSRIHDAVLCLLEARDFDHLCHIVCNDWIDILQVDSVTICFEKDDQCSLPENSNIRLLEKGVINKFLGHENSAILRGNVEAAEEIYGPATPLIKAEALIRLEMSDQNDAAPSVGGQHLGILAFGSRDEAFFTPGQGTELLRFLAAAFHGQMNGLLSRI
ncbi:MAG: DUF484 family protein [Emcibacter sp.]|nr:DUF484 family protein [Emcibacter sp.]